MSFMILLVEQEEASGILLPDTQHQISVSTSRKLLLPIPASVSSAVSTKQQPPWHRKFWFRESASPPTLEVPLLELSDGEHHGVGQLGGQDGVAGAELEEGDGEPRERDVEKSDE